jgi:acetyl-CoA carboxylase alpha subunit
MTKFKIDLVDAVLAIKSDAQVSISNEDITTIEWHDGNPTNITNEQILAKHTELKDQDIADKAAKETNKTSGKAKLKTGEALTDAEVEALFG